jgi:hypothetical protein
MCNIFEVFDLKYWITFSEILSEEERNASQSSDYYYVTRGQYMTADLAISGEPGDLFGNGACNKPTIHNILIQTFVLTHRLVNSW